MQPLFETSGWSLPSTINPQSHKDKPNSKQKKKTPAAASVPTEDRTITNEADALQAQLRKIQQPNDTKKNKKSNRKRKAKKQELEENSVSNTSDKTIVSPEKPAKKAKIDTSKQTTPNASEKPAKKAAKAQVDTPKQPALKAPSEVTDAHAKVPSEASEVTDHETPNVPVTKKGDKVEKKKKALNNQQKKQLQKLLANQKGKTSDEKKQKPVENKEKDLEAKSVPVHATENDGLTPLQRKMKEKLSGARFRWLNEQLYTTKGDEAFNLFQEKPELFNEYHEGFRHQVESWPVNPVNVIVSQLEKLPKDTVIADLGCGDAAIAATLTKQKVLSFDLVAKNENVIACDIAKLPIPGNFVDVAVFSLSLMGTNYIQFLKEAHRVLKPGGELKIAEVVSRFSDVDGFITLLERLGFEYMDKDDSNKMFIMLYFTKQISNPDDEVDEMLQGLTKAQKRAMQKGAGVKTPSTAKLQKRAEELLKPCLYKKR
ncbi:methyltransferase-domain-containing protein [Radiomyces spectabilis]|uniref:methyltransferase-domain-containing protein n=1 Tax=Radiomyces spectabilis TaxID=64574 RepID=UPI00221E93C0|nr:methyltransferase-domain-containing protein [Radiomyces spectabilis]KAI8381571.1 methyltransferase-domain-containing protein [Radiomyces spectabilis]